MLQRPRGIHWAMLAYLSITWGFSFLLIEIGLRSFPPLTLVTLRLAVGALTLYVLMRWQGYSLPVEGRWWLYFAVLSLIGNLVPFSLITWAQVHIASGQAGLLMALMPISTMVLAHFFVAHEQLTPRGILGVLAGFAGVATLIGGDALAGLGGASLVAQLAVVTATFAYAVNSVYTKRLPPLNSLVMGTGSLIVGTLIMLPLALLLEQPLQLHTTAGSWLATMALGIFATGRDRQWLAVYRPCGNMCGHRHEPAPSGPAPELNLRECPGWARSRWVTASAHR
jgi:drug/metabolite transporter (DMT)-like permease